jgi:hypothetical protein
MAREHSTLQKGKRKFCLAIRLWDAVWQWGMTEEGNFRAPLMEALAEFSSSVNIKSRQFPEQIPEIIVEVQS